MTIDSSDNDRLPWRKAARSMNNGACVEVAVASGTILVRDSMNPGGQMVRYPASSWLPFIATVRQGAFDIGR
jgi:hypothetical protein